MKENSNSSRPGDRQKNTKKMSIKKETRERGKDAGQGSKAIDREREKEEEGGQKGDLFIMRMGH